jgi:gliding motility-associated-like protein
MKLLYFLMLWLFSFSVYGQVDVGATALVNPTTPYCGSSNQSVIVTITNFSASTINFTVNNVTVNVSVTGASIQTFNSPVINTGSLASGASMNVLVTTVCDLSAIGIHSINATTVNFSDVNLSNNAMTQVDVVVNDFPTTANAGSDQTYCAPNGNLSGNTPLTGTGTWTLISGSGVVTTPNSPSSTITGLGIGPNVFRWTISNPPCPDSFDDVIITGETLPTAALSSAPGTDAQTACQNTAITPITYTIGGSATGATVSGLPAGLSGTFSAGTFTISGTPTVAGTFNYTVTTTGSICTSASVNGTLTVNPNATIALSSAAGTDAQTMCVNNPITTITYSIGGGGTGATISGLPSGVNGSYVAGTFTINGTPTVPGIYNYTVTTTGTCSQTSASGSITVNPDATIVLTSANDNQTVCQNIAIAPILFTIGGGGTGATASGLPAGITGSFSAGTFTISGSSNVPGIYPYTVTTTGTCIQASSSGTLIIKPDATIALTSGPGTDNQTVCINNAITDITYQISGGGNGATVSGLPSGLSGNYAAGIFTISGTPTAIGTFNYTVNTTGSCLQTAVSGTITINGNTSLTLVSAPGTDVQAVCENTPITTINYTVGGGGTGAIISGLPAGVTGSYAAGLVTISGTPTATGTFNYTVTTTGFCVQTSLSGTITVNPDATIALSSLPATTNQTICVNTPISNIVYTISGGGSGATVSGLPAGITGNYSAGTFTISGTPTVSGSFSYIVNTTGTCAQTSIGGSITVNPDDQISLSSASGTDNQTVCENGSVTAITYAISGGGTGASVSGLPAGMSGSYSAGTFTISGAPTTAGIYNYTVTTSGSCAPASANGTVTVVTGPSITLTSGAGTDAQTVCNNSSITDITYAIGGSATGATVSGLPAGISGTYSAGVFTVSGTATVAGTFNYTITTTGGSCPAVSVTGSITSTVQTLAFISAPFTNDQFTCFGETPVSILYMTGGSATGASVSGLPAGMSGTFSNDTLTISGTPTESGTFFYTVSTSGACTGLSEIGNIHINPPLVGNTSGTDMSVCENSSFTLVGGTVTGGDSLYTYLWESSSNPVGPFSAAAGINDASNYSMGAVSITNPVMYFRRTVFSAGCNDIAAPVVVTVDTAAVALAGGSLTICTGDTGIVYGSIASGGIINWIHDGNGILSGESGTTPAYVADATDAGNTVTLTMNVYSNNACAPMTATSTFTIEVNPLPVAIAGGTSTICPNGASVTVLGASAANGTVMWTHNGSGTLTNETTLFPIYTAAIGDAGDTILLEMVVTGNAVCANVTSDTAWHTIIVSPFGNTYIDAGDDITISAGTSATINAVGPSIIQWNWSPSTGLSDCLLPNLVASPDATTTYVLTGTDVNGCVATDSLTVTVLYNMELVIANLVTPNNDTKNDTWIVQNIEYYPNTSVMVVNREGQIVYESSDYDNSWDGTFEGKPLPDATYYYILQFEKTAESYKGSVTLLRN